MCGFSPAPHRARRAPSMVRDWIGGIGDKPPATWQTFTEYLDHVRGLGLSVNVVQFVGHGALRLATAGAENRPVTPDEQKQMERHLDDAMDAGAFGYSTGLVYAPSVFSSTEELVALARSMAEEEGPLLLPYPGRGGHARARAGRGHPHRRGGRGAGAGGPRQGLRARELGQDGPRAPHVRRRPRPRRGRDRATSTRIRPAAPRWTACSRAGCRTAASPSSSSAWPIPRRASAPSATAWWTASAGGTASGATGWDEIMVATCSRPELEGLHLAEVARRTGREPAQAMMDLVLSEQAGVVHGVLLAERGERGHRHLLCRTP